MSDLKDTSLPSVSLETISTTAQVKPLSEDEGQSPKKPWIWQPSYEDESDYLDAWNEPSWSKEDAPKPDRGLPRAGEETIWTDDGSGWKLSEEEKINFSYVKPGYPVNGFRPLPGDIIIHRGRAPCTARRPGGFVSIYKGDVTRPADPADGAGAGTVTYVTHRFYDGEIVVRFGQVKKTGPDDWSWVPHRKAEVFVHRTDRNPGQWNLASRLTSKPPGPPVYRYDPRWYAVGFPAKPNGQQFQVREGDFFLRLNTAFNKPGPPGYYVSRVENWINRNWYAAAFYDPKTGMDWPKLKPHDMILRASHSLVQGTVVAIAELFWRGESRDSEEWIFQGRDMHFFGGSVNEENLDKFTASAAT
ncbi:hypothetical protein MPTK1_7g03060 [Marchantia polymorpha subsp. ruderalis]|nr:hypothetical protein MARPO_0074s0090 [Marchantia polymorpha]BBN16047.1 hypothetical protein Mp_7g03060 [Marchantia polymorpha subsp. ruderalis]|eukprot:PTQ35118.1 hypothetical protein MARPO_0074s0090 [Marchantia polymorpha]